MIDRPPLWLLFSVTLIGIMANTLIGPAIPDILDHFGQPNSAAGWLVASGPAPAVFLAPVTGVLADRYGRRRVLVPSLILFSVGGLVAATSTSFLVLLAGRFVQGLGAASPIGMVITIIGDHWEGEDRARFIAYNAAVLTIAIAIFPAVGGGLAELGGWRWSFAPQMAGFGVAALLMVKLPPGHRNPSASLGQQLAAVGEVLRLPGVRTVLLLGFSVFVLIFGLFVALFPVFLEDEFGLEVGQRGLMLVIPAVTSTVASLLLPRLRARRGVRRLMVESALVAMASYFLVGVSPWLALIVAASLGYGWFEGVSIPTLQDVVVSTGPASSRAAVVSVWTATVRAGQATGPLLAAGALGLTSQRGVFVGGAVAMGALALLAAVATLPKPTASGDR